MPVYEVNHCIPFSQQQRDALAEFITELHAKSFSTPRLFVNIVFDQPGPKGQIYAGAKARGQTVPNHIRATIRNRPKEMYDEMSVKIQKKWNEVVNDASLGAASLEHLPAEQRKKAKMLHGIVYVPMIAALENGLVVPAPGGEGHWLRENLAYFRELADIHDDTDVQDMLKEVNEREDLREYVK